MQFVLWILCAIAAIIVGQWLGKVLFKAKKDLSEVRRAAQSLAISLREAGLRRIPEALEQFTVGDLDDLLVGVQDLAKLMKAGNETIVKELDGTFDRVLSNKLSTPEGRALVEARLAEAKKLALECAKAAAPVVAKAAVAAALL